MRRSIWLLVLALFTLSCGGGGDSNVSSTVTTTAPPVETTVPATTRPTTASSSTTTIEPPTTSTGPLLGVELLVASEDGVFLVGADGSDQLLIDGPAAFAIDDMEGGILFQQERWSRDRRSVVYRVRSDEGRLIETLVPTGDQGLVLSGIARDDDSTFIYYTRVEGSTPEDSRQTLRRYDIADRDVVELGVVGGWEAGAFPVSVSSQLVLLNWFAEAVSGMDFTDLAGNAAAVAADPSGEGGFVDCSVCPRLGELSQDGSQLVYFEVVEGIGAAVIRHVASGAEIRRVDLGPVGEWTPVSFDLSANHLVVNRSDAAGLATAWIYDLSLVGPEPVALPVVGEAYLSQSPIRVSGVVAAP